MITNIIIKKANNYWKKSNLVNLCGMCLAGFMNQVSERSMVSFILLQILPPSYTKVPALDMIFIYQFKV